MKQRQLRQTLYRLWRHGLCAAVLAATPMVASAQTATLVKDINYLGLEPPQDGFHGYDFVPCGSYLYFNGESKATGRELWRTDGTVEGTQLVVEGGRGENQGLNPGHYACVDSTLFFAGPELWKTNGTASGTSMVKDINPSGSSYPLWFYAAGGLVYFAGNESTHGPEPWVSDGTEAGTVMLGDLKSGSSGSLAGGKPYFFEFDGWVYFVADDGSSGRELWRTDGTAAGTTFFKDINGTGFGAGSDPRGFTSPSSSEFFFSADDGTYGRELWKSDGTAAGTVMVKDIYISGPSSPNELVALGSLLYFAAQDAVNGMELWKSDGTSAGTVMVKDIYPFSSSYPRDLQPVGSVLYFRADDGLNGQELWKSDGTETGTVMVADINTSGSSLPKYLEPLGGEVFFGADDGVNGAELWKSDGTGTGTVMVKDCYPGFNSSNPLNLGPWNGAMFFSATNGSNGIEPWKSDGTVGGTEMLKNVHTEERDSDPWIFVESGGTLFFRATHTSYGDELWKTDGTGPGTVMVKDIRSSTSSSNPSGLFDFNGTLLFAASGAVSQGTELWKSDGTSAGTVLVKDINPGSGSSSPSWKATLGDIVLFKADDGTHGAELWKSDGTEAGTELVKDIVVGSTGSMASLPYVSTVGDVVVFRADDGVNGAELWLTDGTAAGTMLLKDINSGASASSPTSFYSMGGTLFFQATDTTNGAELWKTDGTVAGTTLVKDINSGSTGSSIGIITDWNGILYIQADDGTHGRELWRSDGTETGTYMVKDFWAGVDDSHPSLIGIVNDKMVLNAEDDTHGRELWVTDGTGAGTTFLYEILPGSDWWYSYRLGSHDGFAYFSAFTPQAGLEVWRTDGTSAGTVQVADVRPGTESSNTHTNYSHVLDDQLLFAAVDSADGRELWGMCIGAFYEDLDGDGHGNPNVRVFDCTKPTDYVKLSDDCDDDDETIYGGATELCDLEDNDCDLQADEPAFAGLTSAVSLGGSQCGVRLDWTATTACDGAPVYNVYRSGTSGFTPDGGSLIASCVAGPWLVDTSVVEDSTYHYIVRAENPSAGGGSGPCFGGGEETNVAELSATPTGCAGTAAGMPYFTSRAGDLSVRLEWLNPATGYGMSRVCWKDSDYPTSPLGVDCGNFVDIVGTAGSYGTVVHDGDSPDGIVNDTLYYYGLWNNSSADGSGVWSSRRKTTGRPFDTSSAQKWAYTTGASALAPAGVRPGVAYYVSSNDNVLHSSQAGSSGGMWPSGWVPASMNGPSQGRPIVIPFGAPTISGADTVAFVGSQDGRVYAFDAETGVELWASNVLGGGVQASPSGVFSAFSEPYDLILVGTRTPAGDSKFYGLNLVDGTIAWTFDNGGGDDRIGIISSQAWVDASNSRVYFTSWEGGSTDTVWCLEFDADFATWAWSAAIGNIEAAPNLRGGVLYVGTNAGEVHAFDGTLGTALWAAPYATGDGAVKGSVWVDDQPGGRRLYFSTADKVHALTDNGGSATELWSAITVAGASPVFVIGDDLYVGSSVGNGSLLRIDKASGSQSGVVQIGDPDAEKAIGPAAYDWVNDAVIVGTGTGAVYSVTAGFGGE